MVVTIAVHACDHVLKRVLKVVIYRSQTFLVKYKHLRSLQVCEDQGIPEKLKNVFAALFILYTPCMILVSDKDCIKSLLKNHRSW